MRFPKDHVRLLPSGEPDYAHPFSLVEHMMKCMAEEYPPFLDPYTDPLRVAGRTQVGAHVRVCTDWLVMNHNYDEDGPFIGWETMVLGGRWHRRLWRCGGSREQAQAMHERIVRAVVRLELGPKECSRWRPRKTAGHGSPIAG